MNPFDKIKTLEAQLKAAQERIEDLEHKLSEATGSDDQAINLMIKHNLPRQEAEYLLLFALSKNRVLSQEFLALNARGKNKKTDIPMDKLTCVIVCRLRRRGFEIDTLWGQGYRMNQEQSMRILEDAKNT